MSSGLQKSATEFQPELDVPRLVRLAGQFSIRGARDIGIQAAKPHAVERIDHLEPELELYALLVHHRVLEERHVPIVDGRRPQAAADERNASRGEGWNGRHGMGADPKGERWVCDD